MLSTLNILQITTINITINTGISIFKDNVSIPVSVLRILVCVNQMLKFTISDMFLTVTYE